MYKGKWPLFAKAVVTEMFRMNNIKHPFIRNRCDNFEINSPRFSLTGNTSEAFLNMSRVYFLKIALRSAYACSELF